MSADEYSPEGYFELAAEGDMVVLRCSWPFDFTADEWISIKNRYHAVDYSRAISDAAASGGTGQAHGVTGGFLEVTQENNGFRIEFSRPECGWGAASLQLHVRRPVAELFLQYLPFRVICEPLLARRLTWLRSAPRCGIRRRVCAVVILYLLLLPICSVVMGVLGFWIGRCARELPIIDDKLPWTLRRSQLPTAAANLEITMYIADDDIGALGRYDV